MLSTLSVAVCLGLTSCATTDSKLASTDKDLTMHGIPLWLAGGAKLDREPEAFVPDPAIIHYPRTSAPVKWVLKTDQRDYPAPPSVSKTEPDPLERGRENRIKRLVR